MRRVTREHTNLNYGFGLGNGVGEVSTHLEIDATRVGNATRYLNHRNPPNVDALCEHLSPSLRVLGTKFDAVALVVMIVQGRIRIKFFASEW
jgi:hypothetical protein